MRYALTTSVRGCKLGNFCFGMYVFELGLSLAGVSILRAYVKKKESSFSKLFRLFESHSLNLYFYLQPVTTLIANCHLSTKQHLVVVSTKGCLYLVKDYVGTHWFK